MLLELSYKKGIDLLSRISGRAFKSLTWFSERNISETIHRNKQYLGSRWGLWERQVIAWSRNPLRSAVSVLLAVVLWAVLVFLTYENIVFLIKGSVRDWNELNSFHNVLLAAQLTIIGVIFPLVIGLVGVLIQRKSASRAIWVVYHRYSSFLFAGYSGIALSISLVITKFLKVYLDDRLYLALSGGFSIWFLFNLVMIAWFFRATFIVIQDGERNRLLNRFSVNESFEKSIRKRLIENFVNVMVGKGLIRVPKKLTGKVDDFSIGSGSFAPFGFKFSKPVRLKDVRCRILEIFLWVKLWSIRRSLSDVRMIFPLSVTEKRASDQVVLKGSGFNLNKIEKFILRLAFSFTKKPDPEEDTTDYIMLSLLGSASDDLRDESPKLFSDSLEDLERWHCSIVDALYFTDDGEVDNWILLAPGRFFSSSYLWSYLRAYIELSKLAAEKISSSSHYFGEMCHVYTRLYVWCESPLPFRLSKDLIFSGYLNWKQLLDSTDSANPMVGAVESKNIENALVIEAGAWESWLNYIDYREDDEEAIKFELFAEHCKYTAQRVISSVFRKSELFERWSLNLLNYWYSALPVGVLDRGYLLFNDEPINFKIIFDDEFCEAMGDGQEESERLRKDVISAALGNLWRDIRLIVSAFIYSRGENVGRAYSVVEELLSGETGEETDTMGMVPTSITAQDIFSAYLRQTEIWCSEKSGYGRWLNEFVFMISRVDEPMRVAGRVYSDNLPSDVLSIRKGFVRIAIDRSKTQWTMNASWMQNLFGIKGSHSQREQVVRELNDWLKVGEEINTQEEFDSSLWDNFRESVSSIINKISDENVKDLKARKYDKERLSGFSEIASKKAFSNDDGRLVNRISRFTTANLSREFLRSLRIVGYNKADVLEGVETNRSINEEAWIASAVSKDIDSYVYGEVYRASVNLMEGVESVEALVSELIKIVTTLKDQEDYIALVGDFEIFRRLSSISRNQTGGVGAESISRSRPAGEGYICHIGETPVFRVPNVNFPGCLLLHKDSVESIEYSRINGGEYVNVEPEEIESDELKVDLVFSYKIRVVISGPKIMRLPLVRSETKRS